MRLIAGTGLVLVLALVPAGCGGVAPSPATTPGPSALPTPTVAVTARPSAPASSSPSATPSASAMSQPAVTDLAAEVHRVPSEFTGHISAFASLGDAIIWSGGPRVRDNNLYRLVPGSDQPELLYENLVRDSYLTTVAGSAVGYLFTDERWTNGERRGWWLWYLRASGAEPVLLDQSTDDRIISPTIAMNDRWIAWEVVHGTWEEPINELRFASVDDPAHPTTLFSYPGNDVYMEFPELWEDELWYGIADNDWDALTEKPRVEMIDLTNPAASPTRFGEDMRAFMPAPGRDVIAWKSGGTDELAALNSGLLTLYWRSTGEIDELPLPGDETAAERISYPSVGNRFVAWWDDFQPRQYVYDLAERRFRRIAEYDLTGDEGVNMPSLSGDLLVYRHYLGDDKRYLEWCVLPR
jgi:hypothetical protein